MKLTLKWLALLFFAVSLLPACSSDKLKQDVAPLADAMCQYIGIQNDLRAAIEANDSVAIQQYSTAKNKMTVEITVLNQEFQEKYGDLVKDQEFGKKFKRAMNEAMIDCPHLSAEDRDRMEEELKQ